VRLELVRSKTVPLQHRDANVAEDEVKGTNRMPMSGTAALTIEQCRSRNFSRPTLSNGPPPHANSDTASTPRQQAAAMPSASQNTRSCTRLVVFSDDDPSALEARICVSCIDSTPAPPPIHASTSGHGRPRSASAMFKRYVINNGRETAFRTAARLRVPPYPSPHWHPKSMAPMTTTRTRMASTWTLCYAAGTSSTAPRLLTEFLLPHLESEAACFGRSTSSLCGPYAARLCNVSATVLPVGHNASWDATAARARELLVGLPRQSTDTSIDAMRRLGERSTTDLSFRPVIDPIVVHTQ
jgi:hypothetical protein